MARTGLPIVAAEAALWGRSAGQSKHNQAHSDKGHNGWWYYPLGSTEIGVAVEEGAAHGRRDPLVGNDRQNDQCYLRQTGNDAGCRRNHTGTVGTLARSLNVPLTRRSVTLPMCRLGHRDEIQSERSSLWRVVPARNSRAVYLRTDLDLKRTENHR